MDAEREQCLPDEPERDSAVKIYIAGPMRGYDEFNFPAFRKAATDLRVQGHEVFSPHERDEHNGLNTEGMKGTLDELSREGFSLRHALAADLDWICRQGDAVVLLDGWEFSLGATAEVATADAIGIPVYELDCFLKESHEV
jgi:hypothetical protein